MAKPVTDAEIVAATFRNVIDADAFDDMQEVWGRRFQAQLATGDLGHLDADMREHVRQALEQFRKHEVGPGRSAINEAIALAAPAMVLSPSGVVVATNEAGALDFGALQGRRIGEDWIEGRSVAGFKAILQSAHGFSNRKHAILRTSLPDTSPGLAEAYVIRAEEEKTDLVVVRSLDLEWNPATMAVLEEVFGLTLAECEVARALFETRDTKEIAQARNSSIHTVRTQIKSIQTKTAVSSQMDLVRLLMLLVQRSQIKAAPSNTMWRDPWDNEAMIEGPDGMRLAYSWTGDPDGHPVLIVHNILHGYAFPEAVEERLAKAGICLYAVQRPGFGNSTAAVYNRKTHLDALKLMIETLGLRDVVAVQLSGVMGIVRSALRDPHLYKSILLAGMGPPYTRQVRARMSKAAFAIVLACRATPLLGRLMLESSKRNGREKGMDWLVERVFSASQADLASLRDPEIRPILRNAFELTVSADTEALVWMYQTHLADFDLDLEALTVPVHAMASTDLDYYHEPSVAAFAARSDCFTWEPVSGGGLRLLYQEADLIADRIIAAVQA